MSFLGLASSCRVLKPTHGLISSHILKQWLIISAVTMGKNKNKARFQQQGPAAKKQKHCAPNAGRPPFPAGKMKHPPIPGTIDIQVVGSGRDGTPRSVFVNMDHFRYIFNCGEGTQRVAMEHRMKISKLTEVFITHRSWDNISGLMGMCLSLESVGVQAVQIHGPPDAERLVTMSKGFAQLRTINIKKREVHQNFHRDSAMLTHYIPVLPEGHQNKAEGGSTTRAEMVVVYLCQPHAKPRSIVMEKCVEFGIKSGPQVGQLKRGSSLTLEDGRVVNPEDVLSPPDANNPFLVVECPSPQYVGPLVTNERITALLDAGDAEQIPSLVIHMTSKAILADPRYQVWMERFGPGVKHLVLNDDSSGVSYEGTYRVQAMLNRIDDQIFPLLPHQVDPSSASAKLTEAANVTYGETNLLYLLRRKLSGIFVRDQCITLNNAAFVEQARSDDGLPEILDKTKAALQLARQNAPSTARYPEILFLGTGSAIPSKARNVSAIWLNLSEEKSILLDCGENTYGQLYRHYGSQTDDTLQKLMAIFVSHLHADHHLGIVSMATARKHVLDRKGVTFTPLWVIAPFHLRRWYQDLEDMLGVPILNLVRVIPIEWFSEKWQPRDDEKQEQARQEAMQQLSDTLQMKQILSVRVLHRQFPHGIVLGHEAGWKVAYSGDTMPCDDLAAAAKDCDVLIHEASMEDDLAEEAELKKHSTTSQAIDIGLKANAGFILLTHFSQRYAKVPLFNDNFSNRVGIAFDNMRVSLSELPLLTHILPALKAMFAEDYAEMEERTTRKYLNKKSKAAAEATDQGQGACADDTPSGKTAV